MNYDEDEVQTYLCHTECFDGVQLYERGKRYVIDPKSTIAKHFKVPRRVEEPEDDDEKDALIAELQALGIDAKKTWGIKKLKVALEEASK